MRVVSQSGRQEGTPTSSLPPHAGKSNIVLQKLKDKITEKLTVLVRAVLSDEDVQKKLWAIANTRQPSCHWIAYPNSIREERYHKATAEAGEFVAEHLPGYYGKETHAEVMEDCLDLVDQEGLMLEFGVFTGSSITHIAERFPGRTVHGFDSFEGLPEQWGDAEKGLFSMQGVLPAVPDNVRLHKGWFDDTLPPFVEQHQGPVAFLHVDSDLYSSAKTILNLLAPRIIPGTVILFDEYLNYPYWQEHEHKAFMEYVSEHKVKFDYMAYADKGYSVGVKITSVG